MPSLAHLDDTLDDSDGQARQVAVGVECGQSVGRYVILSRVGAGGMGVVYAAYDPDLDRRVALKLLHPDRERSADGLARLLREAQAMGKLAHPNVVAVHDVGEHDGAVFVAMEFVEGQTMAAWSRASARSRRAILDVLQQAGAGLAAAHAKGLVHRDFKPDNVMIGADGRVRVTDFGLVRVDAEHTPRSPSWDLPATGLLRPGLTRSGSILGTPRYMAPEQWQGGDVGPAADQFAFCLTAYEALYGERAFDEVSIEQQRAGASQGEVRAPPRGSTVPPWIRRILLRGLAISARERWPSMDALLAALRRDPGARRRGIVAATAVLGVAAASWGAFAWDRRQREADCEHEGAALLRAWDDDARALVNDAMLATGVSHAQASFDRAAAELASYAGTWGAVSDELCVASSVAGTLDASHYALARTCLDARAAEFDEIVRILGNPDAEAVHVAVSAALDLPRVERCTEFEVMARQDAAPADDASLAPIRAALAQAAAHRILGDFAGARALAEAAHAQAAALGSPVLEAQAQLELGVAQLELASYDDANARLQSAVELAGASGADGIAAQAAQRLVHLVGSIQARPDEGLMWARQAQMWLDRVDAPADDPRRALVANARAVVISGRGEWAPALVEFGRAVALLEAAMGEDHPETAQALHNRGILEHMLGKTDDGLRDLSMALAIKERAWGPEHPEVAGTLAAQGELLMAVGRRDEAIAALRRSLAIREAALGRDHPVVAHSLYLLAHPLGPTDEAVALLERALAINERAVGPDHPDTAMCVSELGLIAFDRGAFDEARDRFARAAATLERAFGGDHPTLGHLLFNLARATDEGGDPKGGQVILERAATIVERSFGAADPFVGDVWLSVGRGRLAQGDAAGAVVALGKAMTRYGAVGAPASSLEKARVALAEAEAAAGSRGESRRDAPRP